MILKLVLAVGLCLALMHMGRWGWWIIGALVGVVVLFVLANVVYMFYQLGRVDYANWFGADRTAPATFLRKFDRSYDADLALGGDGELAVGHTLYTHRAFWAVFEVRGQELEFRVPEEVYIELEEGLLGQGMTGLLTYKGERFLRFKPTTLGTGPDETGSRKRDRWKLGARVPRSGRP